MVLFVKKMLFFVCLFLSFFVFVGACVKEKSQNIRSEDHEDHEDHEKQVVRIAPKAASHIDIKTIEVSEKVVSSVITTTGIIDFDRSKYAHVGVRISGKLHQVDALLGAQVKKGQRLATVDSISLGRSKNAYLEARVRAELSLQTLERNRLLFKDRVIPEQQVIESKAKNRIAQSQLQGALQELKLLGLSQKYIEKMQAHDKNTSFFPVYSPISGTIIEKHAAIGEIIHPEDNIFTIADLNYLWVWVDIYERDLNHVHLQDTIELQVEAFTDKTFSGKIDYIENQINPNTRTAKARIRVKNNQRALKAGMFAKVTISDPHGIAGEAPEKRIFVPNSAVQRDGNDKIAFVQTAKNTFEKRVLRCGRSNEISTEIISGLSVGEVVVTKGTFILKSEIAKEAMGGGHNH